MVPWTVNDPHDMRRLIGWGVDGLITDRADIARVVFAALGLSRRHHRQAEEVRVDEARASNARRCGFLSLSLAVSASIGTKYSCACGN